jgi:peptidoglycan/LPS O-acetylase OafA/YrhL
MRERPHNPALDGLRAVACLAVIDVHTSIPAFGGGWLGVDAFFVLSGYLITGLLTEELDRTGRTRLGAFYLRRAGRLYPALLVAVAACALLAIAGIDEPHQINGARLALAAVYLTDVWAVMGRSAGPLAHTWSLAVEEQFYLLWPVALIWARFRWRVGLVAIIGGLGSLAAMFWSSGVAGKIDESVYFAAQDRAWELLAGCALSIYAPTIRCRLSGAGTTVTAWLSTLLAAVVVVSAPDISIESAWQCLAIVAATAGILIASEGGSAPVRLLSTRPLVWLGERTYGAYLYHYPFFWAFGQTSLSRSHIAAIAILSTFAVTYASYRWIESPIRNAVRNATRQGDTTRHRLNSAISSQ